MAGRALNVLKSKWFIGGVLIVVALVAFGGQEMMYMTRQYMMGDTLWNPTPRQVNGRTVFDEHYSMHPGHYSFSEKLNIATQIDVMKLVRMDPEERKKGLAEFSTIRTQSPVGTLAPDFKLKTIDGKSIRLSDKRGRIAVFMFVAMTCPPARTQVDLWTELHEQYDPAEVDMFFVYSRERHPGERGFPDFRQTTTTEERMTYATMMSEITDVPIAVDPIDESTLKDYGIVPNAAFVVDRNGYIVFKSQWADVHKIRQVIEQLRAAEAALEESVSGNTGV
ncbi:MAG: redoxin domain-containing protein [Arenicellales bacterium]|jgi:peroxiredoxin|nr:redoxin domain-containing protein [Arenicellales bacterium]